MRKLRLNNCILVIIILLVTGCVQNTSVDFTATPLPLLSPTVEVISTESARIPKVLLPLRGLYVQFERRGYPNDYYSGQVINDLNKFDEVVGKTVKEEISTQLDQINEMGVNTIAFELRSSASTYIPGPFELPTCNISPVLGIQYPNPLDVEITNLKSFLDLLHSKEMKLHLRLVNTHMDDTNKNNEQWLGTILGAIKDHPALDLVLFEGNVFSVDTNGDSVKDACGGPAEPPLWEGPTQPGAMYVKWAIEFAHSLGIPYRQLSAEAIVGNYYSMMKPENRFMTDGHYWEPIEVLKGIFDDLGVPDHERTYALSMYEHNKCITANELACEDLNPHAWALETIDFVTDVIGKNSEARIVLVEMGLLPGNDTSWTTELAFESLVWIMQAYGIDGGDFWRWTSFSNSEDFDNTLAIPIKLRGTGFNYTPVKDMMENLYLEGQSDDLVLVPDADPPEFIKVEFTPNPIRDGDILRISADMGETHLFVFADVSELLPNLEKPVTLSDMGDGTYQATIELTRWNELISGSKQIQIKAMDFWSNETDVQAEVEYTNEGIVISNSTYNGTFEGDYIDPDQWIVKTAGQASVSQDGRMTFKTSAGESYSAATATSVWTLDGDFDIQVDFALGEGWQSPSVEHLDGALFGVSIDGVQYHITKLRNSTQDNLFAFSTDGRLSINIPSDAKQGKYRIARVSNELFLLFNLGEGWKVLTSTTVPILPAQVYFGNGSINAAIGFISYFDNFLIRNGTLKK